MILGAPEYRGYSFYTDFVWWMFADVPGLVRRFAALL